MRWSLQASTVPPANCKTPWMHKPSGSSVTCPPSADSIAAVEVSRSDSFSRSRPACSMTVSPSASAASTLSTGMRSGMGRASIVTLRSAPRRTVTVSSSAVTSAPISRRMSSTARSPCAESRCRPSTRTPAGLSAPIHRKNAAFDQSPSTSTCSGRSYICPPEMEYSHPTFSNRMPAMRSTCSVIAIYAADSTLPVTRNVLLPGSSGSAARRPVTYCDDTFPGISNVSPDNFPLQTSRSPVFSIFMPCSQRIVRSGSRGRSGSRPSM